MLEEVRGVLAVELVLAGAREGCVDLVGELPAVDALEELDGLRLLGEVGELAARHVLEVHDVLEHLLRNATLAEDRARAVGKGENLRSELHEFFGREARDIARTGNDAALALKGLAALGEHVLREVDVAVAGRLGTDQRTAEGEGLARENAREFVREALVLAEEISDFAAADVHVAGGDVGIGADVAEELGHEALAEAHHLGVAAALAGGVGALLRVEVRAALAAAHRERRERVLEDLLEGEELEDGEVDRRVEAQASLVGTDRAVLLDAVAAVDADLARVVHPRNAEYNNALRLDDALENRVLFILRIRLEDRVKREEHFLGGLDELGFVRVLRLEILQDAVNVFAHFNLRFLS